MRGDQLERGTMFGGYRIDYLISRGGMGIVYRARNLALNRIYALKVLTPELADDVLFRERFTREMRIAASLHHPNIVGIHHAGEHEGLLYFVMDYVTGTDLHEVLTKSGAVEASRAVDLLEQLAAALDTAHSRGLVHRDVKPANILISIKDGEEHAYLTDFGLAKKSDTASALTAKGVVVGTVDYMAPEQITGAHTDARTDIYALGCVFYQMLSGEVPYRRENSLATLFAHVHDPAPELDEATLERYPALTPVIERAMAKQPGDRYSSTGDFARDAAAALRGMRYTARPTTVATGEATPTDPPTPVSMDEPMPVQETVGSAAPVGHETIQSAVPASQTIDPSQAPLAATQASGVPSPVMPDLSIPPAVDAPPASEPASTGHATVSANAQPAAPTTASPEGVRAGPPGPGAPGPKRPGRNRLFAGGGILALLVVAAIVVVLSTSGSSKSSPSKPTSMKSTTNPLLQALAGTNQSDTAKGLLPASACKAEGASMVTCTHPAFGADAVTFQTYGSLTALYGAYLAAIKKVSPGAYHSNYGDCTEQQTDGEVSWNHRFQHPRQYSLAQSESGKLMDDQGAGRVFCTFTNGALNIIWTQNDGRLLGDLVGAPHENAWDWWKGVHHSIPLGVSGSSMTSMP